MAQGGEVREPELRTLNNRVVFSETVARIFKNTFKNNYLMYLPGSMTTPVP